MPDKLWNVVVEGTQKPSPNVAGKLRPELSVFLFESGAPYPKAGFTTFYDDMDPTSWLGFVKEAWSDVLGKLPKLGLKQIGPTKWVGTAVPNGVVLKIERHFLRGFGNAIDFGGKHAKNKGHSHEDEFDDEGKKKHGK